LIESLLKSLVLSVRDGDQIGPLELAARQVDKLADSSIPPEERQRRKRRLLKGPGEFRELRADLPKKKA
jgi:hypothetical protein